MDRYPEGFEEDDRLRSKFIRELTLAQLPQSAAHAVDAGAESPAIPRTLVQYWHEPAAVPADVRACLESWNILLECGFTIRLFGDDSAGRYIAERFGGREREAFARCRHPAMRSDYLRICVILAEGGLYVDADDVLVGDGWTKLFRNSALKIHPLCYDVAATRMCRPPVFVDRIYRLGTASST